MCKAYCLCCRDELLLGLARRRGEQLAASVSGLAVVRNRQHAAHHACTSADSPAAGCRCPQVLLAGLSAAQHSHEPVRELAFLLVLGLARHQAELFEPVLDVVLQPLLQGCADESREVRAWQASCGWHVRLERKRKQRAAAFPHARVASAAAVPTGQPISHALGTCLHCPSLLLQVCLAAQQALDALMAAMPPLRCASILSHKLPSEGSLAGGTAVDGEVLCATIRCLQVRVGLCARTQLGWPVHVMHRRAVCMQCSLTDPLLRALPSRSCCASTWHVTSCWRSRRASCCRACLPRSSTAGQTCARPSCSPS